MRCSSPFTIPTHRRERWSNIVTSRSFISKSCCASLNLASDPFALDFEVKEVSLCSGASSALLGTGFEAEVCLDVSSGFKVPQFGLLFKLHVLQLEADKLVNLFAFLITSFIFFGRCVAPAIGRLRQG